MGMAFLLFSGNHGFAQSTLFWKSVESPNAENLIGLTDKSKSLAFSLEPESGAANGLMRYQLFFEGIPIYQAKALGVYDADNQKHQLLFPRENFKGLSEKKVTESEKKPGMFWVEKDEEWFLVQRKNRPSPKGKTEAFIDFVLPSGEILFSEDWLMRSGKDSLVKANVFLPDPVAKLKMNYGGIFRDRGDSNSHILSLALDTVLMLIRYEGDSFRLKNKHFQFGEYSDPVKPLCTSDTGQFQFYRNDPRFEEVNAFFHLNKFRKFFDSLGFTAIANYALRVDAHGMGGADMSAYSPTEDVLALGDGNVDDGEDAAVVVHEYGHALMQSAIPFGNSGLERKATEEGLCDYLAGSYVKSCSDWNWQNLFKWDGHNEFWSGRSLMSPKIYPFNLVGQIHRDGEIFSSFLMNLELLMGRESVHRVLFTLAPFLVANISMPQAAQLFQKVDSTLFGLQHYSLISQVMMSKGLHPSQVIVHNLPLEREKNFSQILDILVFEKSIQISNKQKNSVKATLLDQNGRPLHTFLPIASGQTESLSVEKFSAGIYFLKFESDAGNGVKKIVFLPH